MKNKFMAALFVLCAFAGSALAAGIEERVMRQWTRSERYARDSDQIVELKITYYSAEYVEALVQSEAEKNMWSNDELERYKYNLLKTLNLDESIAFHIDMNVLGSPLYLAPMDKFFKLRLGGKIYDASDYDKRFNFKLSGRRDGMIWFRRYDEKTGRDLLEKVKDIRMSILSHFSMATAGRGDLMFIWDITKDDPSKLTKGQAADRLELDRLLKRMEKLVSERSELEKQLNKVNEEFASINKRVEELQQN
ncbi:MAG: hypothetical protein FWG09_03965 [Synergistaceae bacterium]|nr:hypothetical protein [Synergistaceae bacterium]